MPASTQTTQRALHRFFSYRIVPVFACGWTSPNDQDRYFHSQGLTNRCYTPNLPLGAKRRFVLSHRLFTFKELFQKKRMLTNHVVVAICLLIVLSSQKATVTTTFWCTMVFWTYILIDFRRVHYRPHNPDTRATLKVTTEPNVDWALTTPNGELVVSGW